MSLLSRSARRWRQSTSSSHRRGVAVIVGGTALGQAIIALSSPILSRIYSPAAFGLLAIFTAVVSLGSIVAAARLEMVVPIVREDEDAQEVVRAGLGLCLLAALIGTLACLPVQWLAGEWTVVEQLGGWLWLTPWACACAAAFVLLNQWAVRVADFGAIGRRNTWRALFTVGTQVGTGAAGLRPGGTVLGFTVGHAAGAAIMLRGTPFRTRDIIGGTRAVPSMLRRYRAFCAKLTVSGLFNVAGTQVPVLLFATAYSQTEVGWLGLTMRSLALPVGIIGTAVAQVYVSALAASVRSGLEVRGLFMRVSKQLTAIAALGAIVLLAFGPPLFSVIFGDEWTEAGDYARVLALGIAAQFVAVPLSQTMILVGRTTLQMVWDIGRFVVVCGAVAVAIAVDCSAQETVTVLGAAMLLAHVAQWVMNWRVVQGETQTNATSPRVSP